MILQALLVASPLVLVADEVPRFNLDPSCRAVARIVGGRTPQSCLDDENTAKGTLGEKWTTFPVGDRARCTRMVGMGGPPSYVELLTCLELADQARQLSQRYKETDPATPR